MDRNGKVVGGCIAVDLWTKEGIDSADYYNADPSIEKNSGSRIRLFFLSHLHADHTVGLNSSWCNGPIYTSPMNAKLAPKLLPNFRTAEKLLVPLELEVEHLIPLGDSKDDPKIKVTLMSVFFCFRCVLITNALCHLCGVATVMHSASSKKENKLESKHF